MTATYFFGEGVQVTNKRLASPKKGLCPWKNLEIFIYCSFGRWLLGFFLLLALPVCWFLLQMAYKKLSHIKVASWQKAPSTSTCSWNLLWAVNSMPRPFGSGGYWWRLVFLGFYVQWLLDLVPGAGRLVGTDPILWGEPGDEWLKWSWFENVWDMIGY